jgi:hypothetical protein
LEQNDDDHVDGDGHGDDQVPKLGKEERETKWAQGKGIFDRVISFCHSRR